MIYLSKNLLFETIQYSLILTEAGRVDFLVKTYAEKLGARWNAEKPQEPQYIQSEIEGENGENDGMKVLSFIMTKGDPSRNQSYTQWLLIRYLKGEMKLEDCARIKADLEIFERAKPRLAKKDINQYKNGAELYAAIEPFKTGELEVSKNDADKKLGQEMAKESKLLYNGPDLKVVVPLTKKASCYFGINTQWCTAATDSYNYFDTYNNKGPLYIILDKANNKRWQMHLTESNGRDACELRDERDSSYPLRSLIEEFPQLINIIGEDKLLPFIDQIGSKYFSEEARTKLDDKKLATTIHTKEDYDSLPKEKKNDPDFVKKLIYASNGEAMKWVPQKLYAESLPEILEKNPFFFVNVPRNLKTIELGDQVAAAFNYNYRRIEDQIPIQYRSENVQQKYWISKSQDSDSLTLENIPEQFWDKTIIINCLSKHPTDMEKHKRILNDELVADIIHNFNIYGVSKTLSIPKEFCNSKLVLDAALEKYGAVYQKSNRTDLASFIKRFPKNMWPVNWATDIISGGMSFKDLPEQFKTDPKALLAYIKENQRKFDSIPHEYLTSEVVKGILKSYNLDDIIAKLPNEVVSDADIIDGLTEYSSNESLYKKLPKYLKHRPDIIAKFVYYKAVPIKEIPEQLLTESAICDRVRRHGDEIAQIPKNKFTPNLAARIVEDDQKQIKYIPNNLLTPKVFSAFMGDENRYGYGYKSADEERKEQFQRFDKKYWTPAILEKAINQGLVSDDIAELPENLISGPVALAALNKNIKEFDKIPKNLITDDFLEKAVEHNIDVLDKLDPNQITEPVVYGAMRHASLVSGVSASYRKKERKILQDLPKSEWSARVWNRAIGYIEPLKNCPPKFRTADVLANAFMRDTTTTTKTLKNPASILNKIKDKIYLDNTGNSALDNYNNRKTVRELLEDAGVIVDKDGTFKNIVDLDKKDVDADGLMAKISVIPNRKNMKIYFFTSNDKYIGFLYTNKNRIVIPNPESLVKYRKVVLKVARLYLAGFNAGDVNHLGIYDTNLNNRFGKYDFDYEENANRQKVEGTSFNFSEVRHLDGHKYTLYDGEKPVLSLTEQDKGGGGFHAKRGGIVAVKYLVPATKLLAKSADIIKFLQAARIEGSAHLLTKVGIMGSGDYSSPYFTTMHKQIAKVGSFQAWRSKDILTLVDARKGILSTGIVNNNGKINNREFTLDTIPESDRDRFKEVLNAALDNIQGNLVKKSIEKKASAKKEANAGAAKKRRIKKHFTNIFEMTDDEKRHELLEIAKRVHINMPEERIVDAVNNVSADDLDRMLQVYRDKI